MLYALNATIVTSETRVRPSGYRVVMGCTLALKKPTGHWQITLATEWTHPLISDTPGPCFDRAVQGFQGDSGTKRGAQTGLEPAFPEELGGLGP